MIKILEMSNLNSFCGLAVGSDMAAPVEEAIDE